MQSYNLDSANALKIIEDIIFPLTKTNMEQKIGNIFGACLAKIDNNGEIIIPVVESNSILANNNPLMHGEVTVLFKGFAELNTMNLQDYCLISSHEPCSMCISAIAWAGIKKVFYLFSYEDTAKYFNFSEDLNFCKNIFGSSHPQSSDILQIENLNNLTEFAEKIQNIYSKYIDLSVNISNINTLQS